MVVTVMAVMSLPEGSAEDAAEGGDGVVTLATYDPPRRVEFASGGEYTGYRFEAGVVVDSKVHELPGVSSALTSQLIRVGDDPYFLIVSGAWEGWYVPQSDLVRLADDGSS
jgi:hypothetical protein